MVDRQEMVREEDRAWAEVQDLVGRLTPEQVDRPGLNVEGWSVKDLLWHLACWAAESGLQLERIAAGTYAEPEQDTDELNARFLEEGRRRDLAAVRTELTAARTRATQALGRIDELTPPAIEWFEESGVEHYREHLPELGAWVERLTS
jgi:hypothetical protein